MSNFLNNLASRSLGLAPVVQPRLASRFEPPPNAPRFPAPALLEGDEGERSVEGEAQNARPELRQPETRVVEAGRTVPIPPPATPREEGAERERQAAPPTQQSRPLRPATAAHVPVRPVETRAQNAQTNVVSAPPHAPRASFAEGARPREAVRGDAPRSEDEAALDNRIRRLMAHHLNVGEGNEAARVTPAAPPPAQREREAQDAPEQTQTIRVTIGRIDVRAVTAPAPQDQRRAPARPAPQLSLADYLKQRGGGRR